jgi:hypothetical protein
MYFYTRCNVFYIYKKKNQLNYRCTWEDENPTLLRSWSLPHTVQSALAAPSWCLCFLGQEIIPCHVMFILKVILGWCEKKIFFLYIIYKNALFVCNYIMHLNGYVPDSFCRIFPIMFHVNKGKLNEIVTIAL